MHILQLPTDVVITILSHVSTAKDLCACNQVCKSIHCLFQSSPQLHHRWLLARASLVDSVYGVEHVSLLERSKLVNDLERIWHPRLLLSRRQLKVALEGPCTSYQIHNGVIAAGILSGATGSIEQLHIYRLPSYLTGLKAKLWKHGFTRGIEIDAFKMDPGQDLLVLIGTSVDAPSEGRPSTKSTINIHLRTLSSNTSHPATSLPSLPLSRFLPKRTLESSMGYPHSHTTVRLYRDIIGVLAKPSGDEPDISPTLVIWSWTSGQRLLTFSPNTSIDDFTFIGRETVLLTHHVTSSGPALSTMRISSGRPYSKHPDLSPDPDSPLVLTFFQLPNPLVCSSGCLSVNPIRILCDPVPTDSPLVTTEGNFAPSIFAPSPSMESTIVAFSFPVELHLSGAQETINHTLLVRASTFTRFPEGTSKTPKQYTFAEWSVRGVCWFLGQPGHLFGQRYAHTALDHPRTNVEVYDFNPCHVGTPSVPGWQTLLGQGKDKLPPTIVPKLSLSKRWGRCKSSHKRYLDADLKSTLPYKRQTMRAGITETRVRCALDHERIVSIESERGGLVRGFVAYNI